jgi:peptidoglycan/LPS O-acetylase OafA/YrhL
MSAGRRLWTGHARLPGPVSNASMQRAPIGAGAAKNRPPLPLLTTLRFFAAAQVVAFHVAQTTPGWERSVGSLSVECLFYALFPWLALSVFPILYLPLFIFGMALARLYLFGRVLSPKVHAAMFGIGVILIVLIFGGTWMLPGWSRSDPALALVFALIVFGGAGAAGIFPLLTRPTFILLGEASYSIYSTFPPRAAPYARARLEAA